MTMTPTSLRIAVAVNPAASFGANRAVGLSVAPALREAGHTVTELVEASYRRLQESVTVALKVGQDVLVVVGGDGMVHLGTDAVVNTPVALGIVPTGTGNDLARGLGIPIDDYEAALQLLIASLQRPFRPIDALHITGEATDVWAAGVLSAGFDSLVNERANLMRHPRGKSRYTIALVIEILRLKRRQYALVVDGVARQVEAVLLAAANNQSIGGGMRIAPNALLDDGLIDLLIVTPLSRARLMRVFPTVFKGEHLKFPEVSIEHVRSVTIDSPGIVGFADGERIGPLPLTITVVPRVLRVVRGPDPA